MTPRLFRSILHLLLIVTFAGLAYQPAKANGIVTEITGPAGSEAFGHAIYPLRNGNFVVSDPLFDLGATANVGAVYLYDGATLTLISTLTGSHAEDQLGIHGVVVLENGNFFVLSPTWDNDTAKDAGAVTWCSGVTGCSGEISAANSLVGSHTDDRVGGSTYGELENGSYLIQMPNWDNGTTADAGALAWCSADGGCKGEVSAANSVVGSSASEHAGAFTILKNGDYVVKSAEWNGRKGAIRYCSQNSGCTGEFSAENSLVGSINNDYVGAWVEPLKNGNYVVYAPAYDHPGATNIVDVGAVVFCSISDGGCKGNISLANKLIGSTASDMVGSIVISEQGGYVVYSRFWDNATVMNAGAVTWCSDTTGCSGAVSAANSLVGSNVNDLVGDTGTRLFLKNGDYVVRSTSWDNGSTANVGAVTYCKRAEGGCKGPVTALNSLIGVSADDGNLIDVVADEQTGDYAASFPYWDRPGAADAGLVSFCAAPNGCTGAVSAANSLTGSHTNDRIGATRIYSHNSGIFSFKSQYWNSERGALTLCDLTGCRGLEVSAGNSLVGELPGDQVGIGMTIVEEHNGQVTILAMHQLWHTSTMAVTFCSTPLNSLPSGCAGVVSEENSLVGTSQGDGIDGDVLLFDNGAYVVTTPRWSNGSVQKVGAVTWCPPTGCTGPITAENSLTGVRENDQVGERVDPLYRFDETLQNEFYYGGYVVRSPYLDTETLVNAGAATFCGVRGCTGPVTRENSLVGSWASERLGDWIDPLDNNTFVVLSRYYEFDETSNDVFGALTWCSGASGCQGAIPEQDLSVVGETSVDLQDDFKQITYAYDTVYKRLIVGLPADHKVMVLTWREYLYLPVVTKQ